MTLFGTSAKWLSVIEEKKCEPKNTHKLTTLKAIYSTGSPLKPESYNYVYRSIKSDVLLGSITGKQMGQNLDKSKLKPPGNVSLTGLKAVPI